MYISDPRKLFDSTKEDIFNLSHDHDDDKYRRRPAMDWLNRWLRYEHTEKLTKLVLTGARLSG